MHGIKSSYASALGYEVAKVVRKKKRIVQIHFEKKEMRRIFDDRLQQWVQRPVVVGTFVTDAQGRRLSNQGEQPFYRRIDGKGR